jgi:hypothetical protein
MSKLTPITLKGIAAIMARNQTCKSELLNERIEKALNLLIHVL